MELEDNETRTKIMYYVDRKNVSARYMTIGWFERMETIPESKPTKISISEKLSGEVIVSSVFTGAEKSGIKGMENDYRNKFSVTVQKGNAKESFDFTVSISDTKQLKPKLVLSESDQIYAFYCFVNDAISGTMKFEEFKSEYGYEDCCEAHKVWKACQESTLKCARLGMGELYELSNYLQEKYPDVM